MTKIYIETDMEYLKRKHQQYYKHLNWDEFITNEKLELAHVALQELQQEFNIPDDNLHLEDAYKFIEDLRNIDHWDIAGQWLDEDRQDNPEKYK